MMQLRTLDLFSGIGGFTFALKGLKGTSTVAYCEIDENCRNILKTRMSHGDIHSAPIMADIQLLKGDDLHQLEPNMITAGFPCQDISVANPCGKGLKGEKSGLFNHIIRLVDEYPHIDVILLENSSHIMNSGFDTINQQFKKRGYIVNYVLLRASDVGAHHKRLRWYCLCYKPHAIAMLQPIACTNINYDWEKYRSYNTVVKIKSKTHKKQLLLRCMALGNSIVPQCCMYAWNLLISKTHVNGSASIPYKKSKDLKLIFDDGRKQIIKHAWATPAHSVWNVYSHLTERGSRVLSNQSYYYTGMAKLPIHEKVSHYREYITNPSFVESLMGFPCNWTKLTILSGKVFFVRTSYINDK